MSSVCYRCAVGDTHIWHDDGTWNDEASVEPYRGIDWYGIDKNQKGDEE